MGTGSAIYRIVLLIHVVAAIVGFGALVANGMNNAKAFRSPVDAAGTLLRATQPVARIASYAIYALLALGIVLIAISDDAFSFGAAWVSASFVVWFGMVGVFHGMIRPTVAGLIGRADALTSGGGAKPVLDTDGQAGGLARRLAIGEALIQLLLVIALYLMIWQPGN